DPTTSPVTGPVTGPVTSPVRGSEHGMRPSRLPPRAGLHPLGEHRVHLPQPALPEELLGALDGVTARARHLSPAHVHRVVVPSHRRRLRVVRTLVRTVHPSSDPASPLR